ncbi:MAG: MetQ/NlpA family ABC transporter substrate-binding protein [Tissierellia bacterium]|nr:MetQ/NlpA family ABC transporter substrate-binding protein [Tissierellia bacterium]
MKKIRLGIILLTLILLATTISACGKQTATEEDERIIKLGITGPETEEWLHLKEQLAEEGITLEIIGFSDYTKPNLALSEGEIDINAFQHYAFFNQFKEDHDLDLTAIGETIIAPLGLYSTKLEDIEDVAKGDKIAIPNDETNRGRSLILLQTAGLIEIDPDVEGLPTLQDIVENPLELDIIEVEAATTPRMLEDVALSIINSTIAVDAGFIPMEDSVFIEPVDENTQPYINIFAVKTEDKDDPDLQKLLELYHTDEVKEIINRIYEGSQIPNW